MKRQLIIGMLFVPLFGMAQNVWERPNLEEEKKAEPKAEVVNPDARYLQGAVEEVDGKVEWTLNLDIPGKNAQQIYDTMLSYLSRFTKEENQLEGSCVSLVNKQEHIIAATIKEWLVFKDQFLSLDRTKFFYNLIVNCYDQRLEVRMFRLVYEYEADRNGKGTIIKAEEWINDKNALNKKGDKLYKGSAKFRRKTVDRKDYIFDSIRQLWK